MLCKPVSFEFHIFGDEALPLFKVTGNRESREPAILRQQYYHTQTN